MLGSGNSLGRGSVTSPADVPSLPQCLPLDPITLGNQKYTRSGELRRALGVPLGSTSEEHSFGVTHKKPPALASEELKHFKESVQDTSRMARDRVKQFRDSIFKLDKYREALSLKKRQRGDVSPVERSGGGANLAKIGSQIRRNPQDVMTQRLEERTKSVGLNKRVRTSAADVRADSRPAATSRQPIVREKDGDMLPAVSGANVRIEEKIRRLPVGGDGWDKKMKRKRSVASVGNRVINGDRDMKRVMQPMLNADSKFQSCERSFRSKSSPGVSGINKLDGSFELAGSNAGTIMRNELESPAPRDRTTLLEQRVVAKGNNKLTVQEDNPGNGPSTVLKGKASRTPRTGSIMVLDSSSKVHPSSGTFQGWEQQPTGGKKFPMLGMTNNQKLPISAASPSHAMAQWVGQRPQKISRTRRTNLVSPVTNSEAQALSQGFSTPDLIARTSSFGANDGSPPASTLDNTSPKIMREFENVSSPFGLSESEESGAGETKLKEKGTDGGGVAQKIGSFMLPTGKNKILTNEVGDGIQRQGRSGSSSALMRTSIHLKREKLDNVPTTMPVQNLRLASEKNKSKSGRPPSKKLKDRKASIRVGKMLNGFTSDFTGESDDDHEELLAAANSARNASNLAYSGSFWKKMKSIFASLNSEDMSYLKQQLTFAEELEESLSQVFGDEYNLMGVLVHKGLPDRCDGQERHPCLEKANSDALNGRVDLGKSGKVSPLYQRVLSALIEEDDVEELYHHGEGKNLSLHYASDDSHSGSCSQMDIEPKDRDRLESEVVSEADFQCQKSCLLDRLSCDKSTASNTFKNPITSNSLHSNGLWSGDDDLSHSDFGLVSEICSNDLAQIHTKEINFPSFSSSDCQYQLMCLDDKLLLELQSIGLYPETLPSLAEGEEVINQNVMELKEGLYKQIGRKKNKLRKLDKAIQKGKDVERRNIERCAMDQLIVTAYRKRLACWGSHVSKSAARRVSKHVALAFIERTLARCRKFEEMDSSCFNEPALQDVLFSEPACGNDAKSADCVGSGTASNNCNEASNNQMEVRGSGAVSSTYKRYDIQSDNIDRVSSDTFQTGVRSSKHTLPKHGILPNKVKKEVLIDDVVGCASSRVTSTLNNTNFGGATGKRSERENKNTFRSMSISTGGSPSDSFRSERKTKPKPKLKNNLGNTNILHGTNAAGGSNPSSTNSRIKKDTEVGSSSPGNTRQEPSKEADELGNLELHELDIGDTWFNGLQDHDSMGLEIPMDDLSDLNMLL